MCPKTWLELSPRTICVFLLLLLKMNVQSSQIWAISSCFGCFFTWQQRFERFESLALGFESFSLLQNLPNTNLILKTSVRTFFRSICHCNYVFPRSHYICALASGGNGHGTRRSEREKEREINEGMKQGSLGGCSDPRSSRSYNGIVKR
jgi:hypothetical protein